MQTRSATWFAFGAAMVFGFGVACVVDLPPDGKYMCLSDADCGGNDYVCTPASGGPRYCCKPTGAETCDGKDNDCNGVVDNVPANPCYSANMASLGVGLCHGGLQACADGGLICAGEVTPVSELCNQQDDNCNGVPDDGFDFRNDPQNCGRCGVGCAQPLRCEDGGCAFPTETACSDGADNDGDLAADCADADCFNLPCGTGCVCRNFGKIETGCGDTADNDSDGPVDCADVDCDGGACGAGCQCLAGGKIEVDCGDVADNDGDGPVDCADSDCTTRSCGNGCACAGGQKTEISCGDAADNDGDTDVDCLDLNCDGGACGLGCTCSLGARVESVCNDVQDNDGDGPVDCADVDCDGGICGTGAGCTCLNGQKVETNCFTQNPTTGDEDQDGQANCADLDCLGRPCRSGGRTCRSNGSCQ